RPCATKIWAERIAFSRVQMAMGPHMRISLELMVFWGHRSRNSSRSWACFVCDCSAAASAGRPLASRSKRLPTIVVVLCWDHAPGYGVGGAVDDFVVWIWLYGLVEHELVVRAEVDFHENATGRSPGLLPFKILST